MKINSATALYGVLGYPVGHSKSPLIFNAAFQKQNINAVYLAFLQENSQEAINAVRSLSIKGLSVTIPHKINICQYLDKLDPLAENLGSVNTIINEDGLLTGYNFDGEGAIDPLIKNIPDWQNKNILFIGNGGAARGIAMTMAFKYNITILNFLVRNPKKAASLITDLKNNGVTTNIYSFNNLKNDDVFENIDIIINTTPIGMHPNIDKSPLDSRYIKKKHTLYDIVYTPLQTKFLQYGVEKSAEIISGEGMFISQASLQYNLWTKKNAPYDIMKEALLSELNRN